MNEEHFRRTAILLFSEEQVLQRTHSQHPGALLYRIVTTARQNRRPGSMM